MPVITYTWEGTETLRGTDGQGSKISVVPTVEGMPAFNIKPSKVYLYFTDIVITPDQGWFHRDAFFVNDKYFEYGNADTDDSRKRLIDHILQGSEYVSYNFADFPYKDVKKITFQYSPTAGLQAFGYLKQLKFYVEYTPVANKAPTTVKVSKTNVAPSTSVTLSWSGASAGNSNAIKGYRVYRATSATGTYSTLKTITTSETSGSITVTSPAANNSSYYYKVVTLSAEASEYDSAISTKYATLTTKYAAPTAPTKVTVPAVTVVGDPISVSWSGASAGTNNAITGFELYRAIGTGSYSKIATLSATTTSYTDSSGSTANRKFSYKVITLGTLSNSGYSAVAATNVINPPSVPVIDAPTAGQRIYSTNPRLLVTVSAGGDVSGLTVACPGYAMSRSANLASGAKIVLRRSNAFSAGDTETVTVTNSDGYSHAASASRTIQYVAPVFTDDPAVAGTTPIKAVHLNEIRAMVDDVRAYYGMAAHEWAETITAHETSTLHWAAHVLEIQEQIEAIAAHVNSWDSTNGLNDITLPKFTAPGVPTAAALTELRNAIKLL